MEHEAWQRLVEVDLMGPIQVIEELLPPMIDAGRGGHLVNVSSAARIIGMPWHAGCSASKFGLRGVSEVLRFDLARHRTVDTASTVSRPLVSTPWRSRCPSSVPRHGRGARSCSWPAPGLLVARPPYR